MSEIKDTREIPTASDSTAQVAETHSNENDNAVVNASVSKPLVCWFSSTGFHVLLLLVMAFITWQEVVQANTNVISQKQEEVFEDEIEIPPMPEIIEPEDITLDVTPIEFLTSASEAAPSDVPNEPSTENFDQPLPDFCKLDVGPAIAMESPSHSLLLGTGSQSKDGFGDRRGTDGRDEWMRRIDRWHLIKPTAAALYWLAAHQLPNGSWNFDLHECSPERTGHSSGCACANKGTYSEYVNAATGMALLPFLAFDETHIERKATGSTKGSLYHDCVKAGVSFLQREQQITRNGGHWMQGGHGGMYGHGIASIALCEAFAMTNDKTKDKILHASAQQALNFIAYAQDPIGGGWRYKAKEKGDTSVVGWMIMTLKSGHLAYLKIPHGVDKKASDYLTSVQVDGGAQYGYNGSQPNRKTTSAIGLISRMFLGDFQEDDPALQRGMDYIGKQGFSNDAYFNYYGTQVMYQAGLDDPRWKKWDKQMQTKLLAEQAKDKDSCEFGSWYLGKGGHGNDKGGRLMHTAMNCLCLEVYYRHLSVFENRATKGGGFHIPEVE